MEVEDWNAPWTAREKVWVSIKWRNTFKEVKVSRRRSANWSIFCSVQETQALASGLSQVRAVGHAKGGGRGAEEADGARVAKRGRGAEAADVVSVAETARSEKVTDANHAWRSREFILIKGMEYNLMEISEEIPVEVGTLEACVLCPTDVAGIVDNLAKQARDQEGRRKFVLTKTKKGNQVADVRQHARYRARTEADFHDLQEIIECMDRRCFFFQVTAELQRMPTDNSASILITQMVRFLFLQHCSVSMFLFAFRPNAPLVCFSNLW